MTQRPIRCLIVALGLVFVVSVAAQAQPPVEKASENGAPSQGLTLIFGLASESHPETGIVAAGQPTAEQLSALAAAGFRTVIDLRTEAEDRGFDEPATVRAAGMKYVNLPVNAQSLGPETFSRFFELLEMAERPVLVHCASSNRVGAAYAAYLGARKEVAIETAIERGKQAGLKSEALVQMVRDFLVPYIRP